MTKLKRIFLIVIVLILALCAVASATVGYQYPWFKAWDVNNNPLVGGLIWSYTTGTSTKTPTYSDPACTVPNTNPVVLNSQGEAPIYLKGPTKLVEEGPPVIGGHGPVLHTFDSVAPGSMWTYSGFEAGISYSMVIYGGTQADIQNVLTLIGSDHATIYLAPGLWSIISNMTIPSNVCLKVDKGAVLSILGTQTLTINGPLEAGPYQIFAWTSTGAIALRNGQPAYAEWFGAVGDDSTDDYAAIQKCVDSQAPGGEIKLLAKIYKLTDEILVQKVLTFKGVLGRADDPFDAGWNNTGGGTVIHQTATNKNVFTVRKAAAADMLMFKAEDFVVRGALVSHAGVTGNGMYFENLTAPGYLIVYLRNISVAETAENGLEYYGGITGSRAENINTRWTGKRGIYGHRTAGYDLTDSVWNNIRCYGAGRNSATTDEKVGFHLFSLGNCVVNNLSSNANTGPGARMEGDIRGSHWCFESNSSATYGGGYEVQLGGANGGRIILDDLIISTAYTAFAGYALYCIGGSGGAGNLLAVDIGDIQYIGAIAPAGYRIVANEYANVKIRNMILPPGAGLQPSIDTLCVNKILGYSATCDFGAKITGASIDNVTGDGTNYTIIWDAEDFDSEGVFSTATGLFTAPSAGKYHFDTTVLALGLAAGNTVGTLTFQVDGANTKIVYLPNPGAIRDASDHAPFSASIDLVLTKGQTVGVAISISGGTKIVDVGGTVYSWFTGHRVY